MAAQFKTIPCTACGVDMQVGSNTYKARLCKTCREARYIANLASIMSKDGEPYQRMLDGQRAARERKA